jgi:hypothetical protein
MTSGVNGHHCSQLTTSAQGETVKPGVPGFGDRIKEALVAVFGSVPRAAAGLDTDRSAVYRWTKEQRFPDFEQFEKLAMVGISIDRLLTGRGAVMMAGAPDERYAAGKRAGLEETRSAIPVSRDTPQLGAPRLVAETATRPSVAVDAAAARIDDIRRVVANPSIESTPSASPRKHAKKARRGRP